MSNANTAGAIARITRELAQVQRGADLSLAVACKDSDVRHVRGLIIGPPETPYEYGFFEFEIKMPREYPITAPQVQALTTHGGRVRFNPNIYAEGKVCLSILGTWRGEKGEEWSSAQGLESVMLSIQSLMSAHPYENEPGYETGHKKTDRKPKAYIDKIRHETIRVAVCSRLEGLLDIEKDRTYALPVPKRPRLEGFFSPSAKSPKTTDTSGASSPATEAPVHEYDAEATYNALALDQSHWDPFADLFKRRFLWYYDTYISTVTAEAKLHRPRSPFTRMEFEYPPNSMEGKFDYPDLLKRLQKIKAALSEEEAGWSEQGKKQVANWSQLATQLAFQFKQLQYTWKEGSYETSRLELNLPDPNNPFVWTLTLFGKPMTNLDGGIWNMRLAIPPTFPEAQPRLYLETAIFHHRVSSGGDGNNGAGGILCYFPEKEDEIASHLVAIVAALDDDEPVFDPRAVVNPEAFQLYWGGVEKRKIYSRRLRRSAQDSGEA
ncbi:hypothetical protein LTR62_005088 [Meristemomyces frigidus]|uniref:Ubiquitin-conjugating enzyme E2 Z n=1 Tax=Meristemomyces frigidus TaxID=1508187 RepID=A0AAN7TI71_9PEZI|nr:hypothetical protein LTR62_005088 [Meristemomyces frigidus]